MPKPHTKQSPVTIIYIRDKLSSKKGTFSEVPPLLRRCPSKHRLQRQHQNVVPNLYLKVMVSCT